MTESNDLIQAMKERHSVRSYLDKPIEAEKVNTLKSLINECNTASGLHIQLITDEPRAFGESRMAHYGKFTGVSNYVAMVGKKSKSLDEALGYYGEKIVLAAQMLGLNSCWVGLTYKTVPGKIEVAEGEKLVCVIALGYGANQGVGHKVKHHSKVSDTPLDQTPNWYQRGVAAALLAPTAMNQQKFVFDFKKPNIVSARAKLGFFAHVDLGIVKYHFEAGAGRDNFVWE